MINRTRLYQPHTFTGAAFSAECSRERLQLRPLPSWLRDKIADDERDKGFDCRRSNMCKTCYQVRSKTGACSCYTD